MADSPKWCWVKKVDTENFSDVEVAARNLAQTITNMQAQVSLSKTAAIQHWQGRGCTAFIDLYDVIDQQMKDVSAEFWDIFETLVGAEESYLEGDQGAATDIVDIANEMGAGTSQAQGTGGGSR